MVEASDGSGLQPHLVLEDLTVGQVQFIDNGYKDWFQNMESTSTGELDIIVFIWLS